MKKCRVNHVRRPMAGAVFTGLWVCSVAAVAAPPSGVPRTPARDSRFPSLTDLPVAPPVQAYRTQTVLQREGVADFPLSYAGDAQKLVGGVAAGVCFRSSDCDDCDPCTTDLCDIPPSQINGLCSNLPADTCGSCSDGVFCNGVELCNQTAQCRPATQPACASQPGTVCDELGGPQRLGECVSSCQVDSDCADTSACNGVEVCLLQSCVGGDNAGAACTDDTPCTGVGGFCGGFCRTQGFPCGAVAGCTEGATPGAFTCTLKGRCCVDDGSGSFTVCSRETKPACATLGGRWINVGDNPATVPDEVINCNTPGAPETPNAGEAFNCPRYAAGTLPGATGMIVGQVGAAACNALQELGDDYTIEGCAPGQFFELTTVRWVGGYQVDGVAGDPSRYRVTFRDASLNFIEDTITNPAASGTVALRTVIFGEKPVIPCSGFISIKAAPRFSPFGKFSWAQATAVETGANDPNVMLVNGTVTDFLGAGNNQLAFELVGNLVDTPLGACCDGATGGCARELPWICEKQGNSFQGSGSFCQVCSNDLFKSCTTAADCPACSDTGDKCDPNADCPGGVCTAGACVGGNNDTNPCDVNVGCAGAATCAVGTATCDAVPFACTLSACCNDSDGSCTTVSAPGTCPAGTTSLGFGTACDPNICTQVTPGLNNGYDTCAEASLPANLIQFISAPNPADPLQFQMPLPGDPPTTATLSGNNLGATFGDASGGTCTFNIFTQGGGTDDRGWWHSFSTSACFEVRIDFCGSAERSGEIKQPQWANLWNACNPCVGTVGATVVGSANGIGTNTAAGDRGDPFCGKDDLWQTYGPLAAGTYWVPVFSAPAGTFGDYQLHITVGACPVAACCLPQQLCVNPDRSLELDTQGAVVPCVDDTACSAGAACGFCAETNRLDCDDAGGFWNGFGNVPAGQEVVACDFGKCDLGSCCLGAGDCKDAPNPQVPCDRTIPSTCMDRMTCANLQGSFTGEVLCDNPTPPCPTCEFQGPNNCQLASAPDDGLLFMSDLSASGKNGIVTADDFVPQGTTISKVCVWGTYMDPTLGSQEPNPFDCTGAVPDHFRIRVFNDDAGLPGTLLGEAEATDANIAFGPEPTDNNPQFFLRYDFGFRGYTLTLDTPITGMTPGDTYWLEVANATFVPEGNRCEWHWAQHLDAVNDGFCAVGISPNTVIDPTLDVFSSDSAYIPGSGRGGVDMAFCLSGPNGPLDFSAPPTPLGCCWQCDGVTKAITTARACITPSGNDPGLWDGRDPGCAGSVPPPQPNDTCFKAPGSVSSGVCGNSVVEPGEQCDPPDGGVSCDANCQLICVTQGPPGEGALPIGNGLFKYDTACATNDGPLQVRGDGGNFAFDGDIWYEYRATCTGKLVTDQCGTQTGFTQDGFNAIDSAISIYHDFADPFNCPCPGVTSDVSPLQAGIGGDESCDGIADAGAGFLQQITFMDECWLIRVGGFLTAGGEVGTGSRGRGLISVSCEQVACFPSTQPQPATLLNAGGATVDLRSIRFLSFQGGDAGKKQAVRVTFVSLPAPFDVWNGVQMWVGPPFDSAESGSKGILEGPDAGQPSFRAATLQCTPEFRDWTLDGVVHVFHEGIVPSKLGPGATVAVPAVYELQFIEDSCNTTAEASFSAPLSITTAGWGDLAELSFGEFRAVDDSVSVFDTLAFLAKFSGATSASTKPRNEMLGVGGAGPIGPIDGKIDVNDLVAILNAFSGVSFPFLPPPGPPPCTVSAVAGR